MRSFLDKKKRERENDSKEISMSLHTGTLIYQIGAPCILSSFIFNDFGSCLQILSHRIIIHT